MKKPTLAENMLRYGTKNLTTIDRFILEQDLSVTGTEENEPDDIELDALEDEIIDGDENDPTPLEKLADLLRKNRYDLKRYFRRLMRRLRQKNLNPELVSKKLKKVYKRFKKNIRIFASRQINTDLGTIDNDSYYR